jgi:hypothetical protein
VLGGDDEGTGRVAPRGECLHETDDGWCRERLELDEAAPEELGAGGVATGVRVTRGLLHQLGERAASAGAGGVGPFVELDIAAECDAIEKRRGVQGEGGIDVAGDDRGAEALEIGGEDGGIGPQGEGADQGIGAEFAAEGVAELVEGAAGVFLVGFGPEEGDGAIAGEAAIAGLDGQGQEHEAALGRVGQGRRPVALDEREPAERLEQPHLDSVRIGGGCGKMGLGQRGADLTDE